MLKRVSVTLIAMACLTVFGAFMRPSKSHTQELGKTKIMDYPDVFGGREPLKIKSLGGWTFEAKNVSSQSITKFTLHFVIAQAGGFPLHGKGAHQHKLQIPWGHDNNQILRPGEAAQISIEENIKIISKDSNFDLTNTEIWAFDAYFEGGEKKWVMGKFYKKASGLSTATWAEDASLNPPPSPRIITGRCWIYDQTREWPQTLCTNTACPSCKFFSPQFQRVEGGYQLILTCAYCQNSIGSTCQKPNGFACTQPGVNDLDYSSPC